MNLLQLFSPWKWARKCLKPARSVKRSAHLRRPTFRPSLEVLEDRTLLTAYMVTLATDADADNGGQKANVGANSGDLRWCLTQANTGTGNTITFANQVSGKTIDLEAALPDIDQSMTIAPTNGVTVTVERSNEAGTPNFRIFTIDAENTVTLGAFTIQNGNLNGGAGNSTEGAGIYNDGTLTLSGTTVRKNQTTGDGGGIFNAETLILSGASISTNQASDGGGIYNGSSLSTGGGFDCARA